jgi:putative Ca2+/H+ antiporter (TMEM165/GDT1 family)
MESLFVSTLVVAIAEIGDKTQLLALLLATRFRRPWPIVLGILFATLANHAAAGVLGVWISQHISSGMLRWGLGLSFIAMAVWAFIPDKIEEDRSAGSGYGAFLTTLAAFFLVEIGDKTQVATVALAVRYEELTTVVAGTTLGMLLANVPVVLLGNAAAKRIPLEGIRVVAAALFALLGILVLLG